MTKIGEKTSTIFGSNYFSTFLSAGRLQFWKPRRENLDNKPRDFRSTSIREKYIESIIKKYSLEKNFYGCQDSVLATLNKNICLKRENFSLNVRKGKQDLTFVNEFVLCWRIPMDTKRSVSTTLWKLFARTTKTSRSMSEYDKEHTTFSEKDFFKKHSSGHLESSFQNPAETFFLEGKKFLHLVTKIQQIFIYF